MFLIALMILPGIFAMNLSVEKTSLEEVMIVQTNEPAIFELDVTNNEVTDNFLFYTYFGSGSSPTEPIRIYNSEIKKITIEVYPRPDETKRGHTTFNLFAKATDGAEQIIPLVVNVIDLKNAFTVGSQTFNPDTNTLEIYITNMINKNFESISANFKSPFFEREESFSLAPHEKKTFTIQLNKEDFKEIVAGFYTLRADVTIGEEKAKIEGLMEFSEKDILNVEETKKGFLIRTITTKKSNEGNTIVDSETVIKKNIITRLFTTLTPSPDIVDRKGFKIYYTWDREIMPGETLEIVVRTNWFMPLLVIFLIVTVVVMIKKFTMTNLSLRKRVSFVRANGGEFALKVSLTVHARKYVERIHVMDRLPPLVKLHERFGLEKPSRVNEEAKKIEWDFEKLEAGEMRTLSYIIYSKVGVLGKFALPTATAIYEREGEIHETISNKAFFVSEQIQKN